MTRTSRAALAWGVLGLLIATSTAAAAATTADKPWSGYRVKATSTAAGSWLGARTVSGQVVYRIDPSRTTSTARGFADGVWKGSLTGSGPRSVSATDTARAAWILSKYGSYRYDVQNAAVEIALDELLHGGAWALKGSRTKSRLAQTGQAATIRTFVTTMLADSARYAGPYAVTVTPSPSRADRTVRVAVRVVASRTGAGIASLPVSVTYAGSTTTGLTTGADGSVSTTFPLGAAGVRPVTAVVGKVPESRLLVRTPSPSKASRVVVAGRKTSRTATAQVVVTATPRITTTSTTATIPVTGTPTGRLTVSGSLPSQRAAVVSLFGPFASPASATCAPAQRAASGRVDVTGDGGYAFPALRVPRAGYYVWGATLPADALNSSATSCAGAVTARATPTVTVAPTGSRFRAGSYVHARVTVTGLPTGYADDATLRLFGPFTGSSATSCTASRLKASREVRISADGTVAGPDVKVTNPGYYVWAADLPGSALAEADSSSCTDPRAVFRVTW